MSVDLRQRVAAPSRTSSRRRDIQGLRAIAVLLVVAFHARLPIPGGFVGVDVFFVISGFVITGMLMREWAQHARISFGRFYLRRFLRLTPALAVLVGVVAIASVFLQNPFGAQQTTARTGIGAMLLAANYVIGHAAGDYFAASAVTNPLLNTWSLSVEEQFYLVFPALLVAGWLLARRTRIGPLVVVCTVAAGSFVLSLAWSWDSPLADGVTSLFGGAQSFAFYSSITRAWEFAAGALLALLLARGAAISRSAARSAGLAGALLITLSALLIHDDQPFPGLIALVPVAGSILVILAGTRHTDGVSRVLSTRPLVWVGDISYSWYLWHWPVIVFAALVLPNEPVVLVIAAVASLGPALLSYRYVEQPLRRLRPRSRARAGALIVTTVGIPVALCAALLVGASGGWGLTPPPSDAASLVAGQTGQSPATSDAASGVEAGGAAIDGAPIDGEVEGGEGGSLRSQHAVVRAGCVNTDLDPARCTFGPASASGTVLMAGDSQAYALADGVIAAAERLGLATVATSHTGCPFLGRESTGVHNYPCREWQQSIVEYALDTRPAAVVIANLAGGYVRPGTGWRTIERGDGGRAESVAEAADLYRQALEPIVRELGDAGIPVVVIATVPQMTGYTDSTSLLSQAFGSQAFEKDRAEAEDERAPALAVEESLAADYPTLSVFDPIPALCTDVCTTQRDGQPIYQDETHLAVPGSLLLADGLASALAAAVR
jgi:peptidoglycan/LPS O-acetylase OafA/YrhL